MKEKKKSEKSKKIITFKVSQKSIIAIVAIAVLLIVGAIAGIYAYFIDSDSKTNVFTVGNVKIKLTETNFSQSGAVSDVIPGQTINKNPQIQNTGKNSAYVYMEVIVPKESYTHNGTTVTGQELFTYTPNTSNWTEMTSYEVDGTNSIKRIYYYNQILGVNQTTPALFDTVTVANFPNFNSLSNNQQEIQINAYAIQSQLPEVEAGQNAFTVAYQTYVSQAESGTVAEITVADYGQYVDIGTNILNKSSVTLEGGEHPAADWRVFLKDSGGVWLILADYMPNSAFDVSTVGLELGDGANYTEYGVRSTTGRDALINGLNNSNWVNLISGSDVAGKAGVTVKGAFTIEEWTQSWNACNSGSYPQLTPVYYPTSVTDVARVIGYKIKGGYGTDVNNTTETPDTEYYWTYVKRGGGYENNLYFPHKSYSNLNGGTNDIRAYWLASLSAQYATDVMRVYSYGSVDPYNYYYSANGVRPAVYLPSDIQLDRSRADYWSIR